MLIKTYYDIPLGKSLFENKLDFSPPSTYIDRIFAYKRMAKFNGRFIILNL